jgi:hypothetical protein
VVRHGDRGHLEGRGLPDEAVDTIGAIKQAVLGVNVEVNELGAGHAVLKRRWLIIVSGRAREVKLRTERRKGRRVPQRACKMEKNYQISPRNGVPLGTQDAMLFCGSESPLKFA